MIVKFFGCGKDEVNRMNFNDYQEKARAFAVFKEHQYPFLALAEEVGEFLSIPAKQSRGDDLIARYGSIDKINDMLVKEAGDVLWQLSACLDSYGLSLQDVAETNIEKLNDRKKRDVIKGSGDDR